MTKSSLRLTAALLTLSVSAGQAFAHVTSASGGGSSGPVFTDSPQTLAKGKTAASITYQRFDLDSFSDEFLEGVALDGFEEVHNTDVIQIPSLGLSYGLTDRLELQVNIPFVSRTGISEGELEEPGEAEIEILGDSFGFGDITLGAQYHALTQNHAPLDVAFSIGLKLPTGQTDELEDDGTEFETEFQPGSGSADVIVGTAIGKNYWSFDNGRSLTLGGELLFQDQQRETVGLDVDENSGGTQLFIAPSLRYSFTERFGIFGAVAFPITEDLNGIQNDTDFRLTTGISFSY